MNPLLLPPKLVLRALDDLHTIAQAAAGLEDIERRIDERLVAIIALGERIAEIGDAVDGRLDEVMATGDRVEQAAQEVALVGRQVAEALPVLQRAITMAEPLEGAVERLGRIVDRLPGGVRQRGGGA